MQAAVTVLIYALAATIVIGLAVFTAVGLSILRTLREAEADREKIERGARWP